MKTPAKLGLLASLYLSQGLPYGFFTQALPVLMRKQGLSLPDIGLANLLALPWALKFLWAPLVDRYGSMAFGRRRSWILPLQALSAVTVGGLAFVDPARGLAIMMAALFLTNLLAATQDIATDGLAVALLDERERGLGNGVQVAGYRVGMILGGGLLVIVFDRAGWLSTFASMAAMLAVATIPVALYREPPPPAAAASAAASAVKISGAAWVDVLRRPRMLPWLALLAIYKFGDAMASTMVRPLLVDRGMSLEDIGALLGVAGFFAGLCGALLGGFAAGRFGRKKALLGCGALQVAGVVAYIAPAAGFGGAPALAFASALEHLTGGMATVSLFTLMMDACREETAATDYTVQASVVVVATGVAAVVSGMSAQALGYTGHFGICAALAALGVGLAAWAFSRGVAPPPRERAPEEH
jgi:RhtX/FptX family siderophore transporter